MARTVVDWRHLRRMDALEDLEGGCAVSAFFGFFPQVASDGSVVGDGDGDGSHFVSFATMPCYATMPFVVVVPLLLLFVDG